MRTDFLNPSDNIVPNMQINHNRKLNFNKKCYNTHLFSRNDLLIRDHGALDAHHGTSLQHVAKGPRSNVLQFRDSNDKLGLLDFVPSWRRTPHCFQNNEHRLWESSCANNNCSSLSTPRSDFNGLPPPTQEFKESKYQMIDSE